MGNLRAYKLWWVLGGLAWAAYLYALLRWFSASEHQRAWAMAIGTAAVFGGACWIVFCFRSPIVSVRGRLFLWSRVLGPFGTVQLLAGLTLLAWAAGWMTASSYCAVLSVISVVLGFIARAIADRR